MKKNIVFYSVFILFLLSLVFGFYTQKNFKNYINPPYNTMNVILNAKIKNPSDIILKINNSYYDIPKSANLLNRKITSRADSLDILVNHNFKDKIQDIVIFNDIKLSYFRDLSFFKYEDICMGQNNQNCYRKYEIPKNIKYNKNSKSFNYRNHLNTLCAFILSIFSFDIHYIFSYILLFFLIFYFMNNKIKILNIKPLYCTIALFLLGVILRYNGLFDYGLFNDEFYSVEYSNPKNPINLMFQDAGNPPLFYIILRIWFSIFDISLISSKSFVFILGIISLFTFWLFFEKKFDKKSANFALFMMSVSVPLIYFSSELRCYILMILFTPLFIYSFFELLDKKDKKSFIFYGILVFILSNIHYYEVLFIFSNFIYALFFLYRDKKNLSKFILTNILALLPFLLFFIFVSYQGALLNSSFNLWIPKTDIRQILKCVFYVFGGGVSFVLSLVMFFRALYKKDLKDRRIILYCYYTVIFVFILAVILSYLIRPMLVERYVVFLVPLFLVFFILSFEKKYALFFILWFLIIQSGYHLENNNKKGLIELPIELSMQYETPKNRYVILNIFLKEENKFLKLDKNTKYLYKAQNEIRNTIDEIIKNDKNSVIFTSLLNIKGDIEKGYYCYFNSKSDICLWKIEQ